MNNYKQIKVFIGYDPVESIAWYVFAHSIERRASRPVQITPVALHQLRNEMTRPWHEKQSNDFAFSRWLVPYLCDYKGWAIFVDCDMLCLSDINELWELRDSRYAVQVIKHKHKPKETRKYLDRPQIVYEKKNWSSVMLMNCTRCKALTPEYVNTASGLELHQFKWLENETLIGALPKEWNHLVGYAPPNSTAKIAHFTSGGPYFDEFKNCEFSDEWQQELYSMIHCDQKIDNISLTGKS